MLSTALVEIISLSAAVICQLPLHCTGKAWLDSLTFQRCCKLETNISEVGSFESELGFVTSNSKVWQFGKLARQLLLAYHNIIS